MLLPSLPVIASGNVREGFSLKSINSGISVTDASFKNSSASVFNIQDLHFNKEAQQKIYTLLEQLVKTYPKLELYVEGASQKSGFDRIYYNLGKKNGEALIDALFESGNMSGAEYFAAKNGKMINPVEDKRIYESNLLLFADLIESRNKVLGFISPIESEFSALRNRYFSKQQNKLFSVYKTYLSNSEVKQQYYKYIRDEASKNGFNINEYPNIALYMLISDMSVSASSKKLRVEFEKLFTDLKSLLSYRQYAEFISLSSNEGDRYALMSYLYENREQIGLDKYPELKKFVFSLALSEKVNEIEFLSEENNLLSALTVSMSQDPNIKDILFLSSFLEIYKKVLTASAAPHEYEYYKNNLDAFKKASARYTGKNSLNDLRVYEIKAQDFNETNLKRNEIFVNNMFGEQNNTKTVYLSDVFGLAANTGKVFEKSVKSQVKVLIAGGFHTSGINEILNEKQISNITFTPKLLSKHTDYSEKYVEYAKSLSYVQNNAIPLPLLTDLLPSALAERMLDLIPDLRKKGFSDEDIIAGIKEFMSLKEEISGISVDYIEKTDIFLISFQENEAAKTITQKTGAEIVSEKSVTFSKNLSALTADIFRDIVSVFSNDILRWGLREALKKFSYTEEKIEEILRSNPKTEKIEEVWRGLDFGAFFDREKDLSMRIIKKLFNSPVDKDYQNIQSYIKTEIDALFPGMYEKENIEIIISDSSKLISESGYCIALADRSVNSLKLYIHEEFIKAVDNLPAAEKKLRVQSLLYHEFFESNALYDTNSEIYLSFGEYLAANEIGEEGRITDVFHKYLVSEDFGRFSKRVYGTNMAKIQESLNLFINSLADSFIAQHEEIEHIHKIDSFIDINKELADDMIFLKMGDKQTVEKYALKFKKYLSEKIGNDNADNYAIAVRETVPQHIMHTIVEHALALLEEEGIKIETVYISQKEYMNYSPVLGEASIDNTRGGFYIDLRQTAKVAEKNVIYVEDTCKTGFLFSQVSKVLNSAHADKVTPLALFDVRGAAAPRGIKNQTWNAPIDETFNVNDLLLKYLKENPQEAAEKIIEMQGQASKYFYYALFSLMEQSPESFKQIISVLNGRTKKATLAKANILKDMAEIQQFYPKIAHSLTPLIYFISANKTGINRRELTNALHAAETLFEEKQTKKQLKLEKEDIASWGKNIGLLPLYAKIAGYTKISLVLPKDALDLSLQQDLALSSKTLNISCLLEYESEENYDEKIISQYRDKIDKALSETKIRTKVLAAKADFASMIKAGNENAAKIYKERIKEIMRDIDSLVNGVLNIPVSPYAYSIVLGGSVSKESATPDSDIYFDIIADSKETADLLSSFTALFTYALNESKITAYLSGSYGVSYVGEKITSFGLETDADINDERGVAKFFDLEPVFDSAAEKTVYNNYIKSVSKSLENSDDRNILQSQILSIGVPYLEILNNGSYAGETGSRAFFGNLYAAAYDKNDMKYDYRWILRSLEIALKDILLRNSGKINLPDVPKNTEELIKFIIKNGLAGENFNNTNAESLAKAWKLISDSRMKKDSEGKNYEWVRMTEEEIKSIDEIKHFVNTALNIRERLHDEQWHKKFEYNDAVKHIIRAAKEKYTEKEYKKVLAKISYYKQWSDKNAVSDEMMIALLLCELPDGGFSIADAVENTTHGIKKSNIIFNIQKLRQIKNLPDYNSVTNDFGIQNYMDFIICSAANSDAMTAIFASKLVDALTDEDEKALTNLFTVYIPLARRLNQNDIFEAMRNAVFIKTNPAGYSETLRKIEQYVGSERGYVGYTDILNSCADEFEKILKNTLVKKFEVSSRVKSVYSIHEKINSSRKNYGQYAKIEDKARDIFGLHVVVDKEEREKAMDAIENSFGNIYGFSISKNKKFEYDVDKGFASMRYEFKYKGKKIGELILYSNEEYEREHYGMISDDAYKYPTSHWIYKLGQSIKFDGDQQTYPDGNFAMKIALKHLFPGFSEDIEDEEKTFYFHSDNLILSGPTASDNFRRVHNSLTANKRYAVVSFDEGSRYEIISLPPNSKGYDFAAALSLTINEQKYEFMKIYDSHGSEIDLSRSIDSLGFYTAKPEEGYNPFENVSPESVIASPKAKVLESIKGDYSALEPIFQELMDKSYLNNDHYIFAESKGLSLEELGYAIFKNNDKDLENELLDYLLAKNQYIFETKISVENVRQHPLAISEILLKYNSLFSFAPADAERGYKAYKIIFSGNREQLQDIISKLDDAGYKIVTTRDGSGVKNKPVYLNMLQALGTNIAGLLGISQSINNYPVVAANALIALFDSGAFNETFFDGNNLLLNAEAEKIISNLADSFKSERAFDEYDFDLKISDNPDLITENAFALSTLGVDNDSKRMTLYIHKTFLNALEGLSDNERDFYLTQLVIHEAGEYLELAAGKSTDYEEYHKNIEISDPNQKKLMEFAEAAIKLNSSGINYSDISRSAFDAANPAALPSALAKTATDLTAVKKDTYSDNKRQTASYYERIAGYIEKIETSASSNSLYNEKLPVSAILKSENNTGIGELTALINYSQNVLKESSVNGFTMYDLFVSQANPQAANYLLLDWLAIEEAKGVVSAEELSTGIAERDTADINAVAKRKLSAAQKVYSSLNKEQKDVIDAYYTQNSLWIDELSANENQKYGLNADNKVFAMQQMFFERQLKQTLVQISEMNISMLLKGLTPANAKNTIKKWSALGISSFNIDIENVNDEILKNLREGINESGRFATVFVKSANQNAESAQKISEYGFTPVIPFEKRSQFNTANTNFRVEIDDAALANNADIKNLLKTTAVSGAKFVDYPIGLLWGERVSSEAMENYRIPPKGSRRFGGINLGLFKLGQETFEESYSGSYNKAVETGFNFDVPESINIQTAGAISVNGKQLPLMLAATIAGSLAKQNNLNSLNSEEFENIIESFRTSLNMASVMPEASVYIRNGLKKYKDSSDEEEKLIEAAKLAGFIQGLSEKLIINGAKGAFVSKDAARVYSKLVMERSLFESGFYPADHKGVLPVEPLSENIHHILDNMNLKNATTEIMLLLNNFAARSADTNFTFDLSNLESLTTDNTQSKKAANVYTAVIDIMSDILIDIKVNKEDVKKSLTVIPYNAIVSILSAA